MTIGFLATQLPAAIFNVEVDQAELFRWFLDDRFNVRVTKHVEIWRISDYSSLLQRLKGHLEISIDFCLDGNTVVSVRSFQLLYFHIVVAVSTVPM